jgi:hypothetical protein
MFKVGDKVKRIYVWFLPLHGISRDVGTISIVSAVSYCGNWLSLEGQTKGKHLMPFQASCYELVKEENVKTPHKHAELIKAWADGAKIQYRDESWGWTTVNNPMWVPDMFYRIQPEPKPDVVSIVRPT